MELSELNVQVGDEPVFWRKGDFWNVVVGVDYDVGSDAGGSGDRNIEDVRVDVGYRWLGGQGDGFGGVEVRVLGRVGLEAKGNNGGGVMVFALGGGGNAVGGRRDEVD